jgi:hypothetical protein
MRFLLALVPLLTAACAPVPEPAAAPSTTAAPPPAAFAKATPPVVAQPVSVPGIVTTSAPMSCPDRPERLRRAKETISAYHEHMRALIPLAKWALAHKCELKDTTGSVLVSRTKEAGGVRVTTTHGHANDIVCNVPAAQHPEGLDVERMMQIEKLDEIGMSDPLVDFGENCEDAELEVTYGDTDKQKKILALP